MACGVGSSPARGGIILETATLGPNPTPAIGLGGLQWVGARFTVTQATQVDQIGANLEGASTIFGAIVPLGPDGLPTMPPSKIESFALAGASFTVTLTVADVSVPLSVALAPGSYGVVFGVGAFGAGGGANLTGGNIPTSQSSFFSQTPLVGDVWLDRPDLSGLRIFVIGTQSVPEPSTWIMTGTGLIAIIGAGLRRRADTSTSIRKRSRSSAI
jgi:hypothetical protein